MSRYYVYIGGQVAGPYAPAEMTAQLQPDLQVCVEGESAWRRAADVAELAGMMPRPAATGPSLPAAAPAAVQAEPKPPSHLPPKLQEFWRICAAATTEQLQEQRRQHWMDYFKKEQDIIAAELSRRGA